MLMMAGPMTTTNSAGKMQNTMGMSIFTGAFWARSWASWRRLIRISSDWARSTRPIDTPKVSAWRMASTNERSSGTLVRCSMARMASERLAPARTSPSIRANSSESGPGTAAMVRSRACSKPRPASTLMVSRSRMSGSLRCSSFWRSSTRRFSQASGRAPGPARAAPRRGAASSRASADGFQRNMTISTGSTAADGEHPHGQEAVDGVRVGRCPRRRTCGGRCRRSPPGVNRLPEVGEAAHDRGDGPLPERHQQLLVADVLDLVALELAQRVAHDRLLVGLGDPRGTPRRRWRRREGCLRAEVPWQVSCQISMSMSFFIHTKPMRAATMPTPEHHVAGRGVDQLLGVVRVHDEHDHPRARSAGSRGPPRDDPALGGEGGDVTAQALRGPPSSRPR